MTTGFFPVPPRKLLLAHGLLLWALTQAAPLYADPNTTVDYQWIANNTANWGTTSGTWSPAPPNSDGPTGVGIYVRLVRSLSANAVITVDGTKTLGRLDIGDSSNSNGIDQITLQSGTSGLLNFDGNGGTAQFNAISTSEADLISIGIRLSSNLDITNSTVNGPLRFTGTMANLSGSNTVRFFGTATNSTTINSGTTNSFAPTAIEVVSGNTALGGSNKIADSTSLTVSGGTFGIATFSDTVGSISLTAGNITGTTGVLTASASDLKAGTVSAKLGGSGTVAKTGAGTVILSGVNTYTGATEVSEGTLLIQAGGSIAASSLVTVSGTGILGGGGTVGAVSLETGGTVGPGASAGILTTGALTFNTGSHFAVELGKTGATPVAGTDYDQLVAGGNVTFTGADLALTLNGGIAEGDIFYILSKTTAGGYLGDGLFTSVNGVATPLGQGAEFTFGGQAFRISYDANWTGDAGTSSFSAGGNDIALLALPIPEPAAGGLLIGGLGALFLARRRRAFRVER